MLDETKIRIALGIISGRNKIENLTVFDLDELGYDSCKFSSFGRPDADEIQLQAEQIIYRALVKD